MESDIIKISHLNKSFSEVKAVNDLSFRVKKGELFAFLGVNGAGTVSYTHLDVYKRQPVFCPVKARSTVPSSTRLIAPELSVCQEWKYTSGYILPKPARSSGRR